MRTEKGRKNRVAYKWGSISSGKIRRDLMFSLLPTFLAIICVINQISKSIVLEAFFHSFDSVFAYDLITNKCINKNNDSQP